MLEESMNFESVRILEKAIVP